MYEIHFCFLPGYVDTGQCCLGAFQRNGSILTAQCSTGQGRAAGSTEKKGTEKSLNKASPGHQETRDYFHTEFYFLRCPDEATVVLFSRFQEKI